MDKAERIGLGVAAAGHILLFAVLSLGLFTRPKPVPSLSDPMDVQLVDNIGLRSAMPQAAVEPPAPSVAPDPGPPADAAPPEPVPTPPAPEPTPPPPAPKAEPKPAPAPKPVAKPAPEKAKPAPAKPAPEKAEAPAKPAASKSRLSADIVKGLRDPAPARGNGSDAKSDKPRATGSRLGKDFLKGISSASEGKAATPPAATISATAMAGLSAAIQRQIQPCADKRSSPGPGSERITSVLRLRFRKDGALAAVPQVTRQMGVDADNQRYAQRVGELAVGIVQECSPLDLPADLYDVGNGQGWNDILFRYRLPG
ncbi:cell envelope biogenesis protein TolA [Sphingomonas oleivorans]|uniref:Cell envelope biogenesis protein TolA n=1 Tax=Sphingomonas oleivorans TaxID=1735121 RepID=A0A2T5G2W1_9SPHN|nr:cell envelope biogenesis protein TolA [Sphingomonas oleivorans]PTQ13484.1 cell envelope biogenesis protein TolA [Sphingomonas oleivorans]